MDPATSDQDWRSAGLCAQSDPDLFFAVGALEHKQAKRICRSCPVQQQCLTYAMESPVDHGIWGGLTERERRRRRATLPSATLPSAALPSAALPGGSSADAPRSPYPAAVLPPG